MAMDLTPGISSVFLVQPENNMKASFQKAHFSGDSKAIYTVVLVLGVVVLMFS